MASFPHPPASRLNQAANQLPAALLPSMPDNKSVSRDVFAALGAINGAWKGGPSTASGTTAQLFFQTTKPYTGGAISLADGSAALGVTTPEPASMGLMGSGLVMLGLLARKRAKHSMTTNLA